MNHINNQPFTQSHRFHHLYEYTTGAARTTIKPFVPAKDVDGAIKALDRRYRRHYNIKSETLKELLKCPPISDSASEINKLVALGAACQAAYGLSDDSSDSEENGQVIYENLEDKLGQTLFDRWVSDSAQR